MLAPPTDHRDTIPGVYRYHRKYCARILHRDRWVWLGLYPSAREAEQVRQQADAMKRAGLFEGCDTAMDVRHLVRQKMRPVHA